MIWGADNYDPDAKIPCENDAGVQTCCNKDACPDPNSCEYDRFCAGAYYGGGSNTGLCTGECKSCKKRYKLVEAAGGEYRCVKCGEDDEDEECKLGCSVTGDNSTTNTIKTLTKTVGNALTGTKIGGLSLLSWGLIGLIAGGAVAATSE